MSIYIAGLENKGYWLYWVTIDLLLKIIELFNETAQVRVSILEGSFSAVSKPMFASK